MRRAGMMAVGIAPMRLIADGPALSALAHLVRHRSAETRSLRSTFVEVNTPVRITGVEQWRDRGHTAATHGIAVGKRGRSPPDSGRFWRGPRC